MSDSRRVLFLQVTEAGAYPPTIHACMLMAEAGWEVTVLNAPFSGREIAIPTHPKVRIRNIRPRPSYVVGKSDYARYGLSAARLALAFRPHVVYASDPLGAGPGLIAARLANAGLVYHEHDTPAPGTQRSWMTRLRAKAARTARMVVFPNAERARIAQAELGFRHEQLRVVWNVPRRAEIPSNRARPALPLMAYYHGSITPERLPKAVVEAICSFQGRIRLHIAGYEAPGAPSYVAHLVELGGDRGGRPLVEYTGLLTRDRLLDEAARRGHIGLALMPRNSLDVNTRHMTGASNKAFDYMAAGLPLLVTDLPDWQDMFVAPGYARACDPSDRQSVAAQLGWFADNPTEVYKMGSDGRAKIASDWNYDNAFAPLLEQLAYSG